CVSALLFTYPQTPHLSTLSLHDALPISFAHGVGVLLGVPDKDVAGVELVKAGVAQQDAGLDVGDVLGALLVHGGKVGPRVLEAVDRKSTRLNSSHVSISYAVFCLKKKTK